MIIKNLQLKIFVNLLNDKLSGTELIIISPFLPQHFDFKIHKLAVKLSFMSKKNFLIRKIDKLSSSPSSTR